MGHFKQAGKYEITATVFHSNKEIASTNKTITVKQAFHPKARLRGLRMRSPLCVVGLQR